MMMEVLKGDLVVTNRPLAFRHDIKLGDYLIAVDPTFIFNTKLLHTDVGIVLNDHVGSISDMALVLVGYNVMAMWKHHLNILRKFDD